MPILFNEHSISRAADRALHRQLADLVRSAIDDHRLRPDDPLPSEAELSSATGVSRTAVRDALDILAGEGLIVKRSGTVTRVATPPLVRHMATSRYAEEMALLRAGGEHPPTSAFTVDHGIDWDAYTVSATYAEDAATDADADALALTPGDPVLRRHLVKFVAGDPVQVQDSVIPLALVAGTPVADPARQPWRGGTLAELYSVGLVVTKVTEEARSRPPSTAERKALEMIAAGPVLEIVRVFHVEHRPVEFSTAVVPAARTLLRFETELPPATQSGAKADPYELAALLEMFREDLHPAYANTSRRGRGIGGQAITSQCNYLDPEGDEYRIIDRIDSTIQEWFRQAKRDGVDMLEVRRRIMEIETPATTGDSP